MDLKVALCISGQMRTYDYCFKNLKKHILDVLSPDVFIHTWEEVGNTTKNNSKGSNKAKKVVTQRGLMKKYKAKAVVVEPFDKEYFNSLGGVKVPAELIRLEPIHYKGALPMFYKIYQCNKLKEIEEAKYNFKYDVVIRIRPDILIMEPIPVQFLKENGLLWHSDLWLNPAAQISDKFAFSSSHIMDYYSSVFIYLSKYWENPAGDGESDLSHRVGERLMKYHFEISRYSYQLFSVNCKLIRNDNLKFRNRVKQSKYFSASKTIFKSIMKKT